MFFFTAGALFFGAAAFFDDTFARDCVSGSSESSDDDSESDHDMFSFVSPCFVKNETIKTLKLIE